MTNQLIETLENQHKEMGLLIQQLRKANITIEDVKEHFGVATDVIEFEGKKYRKVDREAREGDVVVFENVGRLNCGTNDNKPYKVVRGDFYEDESNGLTWVYGWNESCPNPIVYEPITSVFAKNEYAEQVKEEKTPNQLRAEIIEKAKNYDENLNAKFEYFINVEKRTVVAIIKDYRRGKDVLARGIAKCMPGDVFNEHIGKAIALGRALEVDVSEFEQAVQPNEVVVGHKVSNRFDDEINEITTIVGGKLHTDGTDMYWPDDSLRRKVITIINDTNAQYGGNA